MKVELIARKGFGVTKKGGRVRVPRDHAKVLVRMGLAEYAPEEVKPAPTLTLPSKATYKRRDMVAAAPAPAFSQVPMLTRDVKTPQA